MAERIVSPGVFTREKDLSFLPQGIGEIGAALIGSTVKGPAFVPTTVQSYQEFQQVFGGLTEDSYLPYTAQAYLEDAGTATIVRVLGQDGYTLENPIALQVSSTQMMMHLFQLSLLHQIHLYLIQSQSLGVILLLL